MTSDFPTAPSAYGLNGPSATVTVEKSILASHTEILTAPYRLTSAHPTKQLPLVATTPCLLVDASRKVMTLLNIPPSIALRAAIFTTMIAGSLATLMPAVAADRALIMTISSYPRSPLPGVAHDDGNARQILRQLEFAQDNIRSLRDAELDAAGMQRALTQLAKETGNGDRVFIYFSGHGGSQVVGSQCQQSLISHDLRSVAPEEIADALSSIKDRAAKVMMLVDACHSGGVVTSAGARGVDETDLRPKFFDSLFSSARCPQPANIIEERIRGLRSSRGVPVQRNYVYIAAAKADEVAFDTSAGGMATTALLACLQFGAKDEDASGSVSFRELATCAQKRIDDRMKTNQTRLAHHITIAGSGDLPLISRPAPTVAAANPVATLRDLANTADSRWSVQLHASPPRARIGKDAFRLSVTSSEDGYLTLLYVGSDGKEFMQLYPDTTGQQKYVQAGMPFHIPSEFASQGPAGTNKVLAIVSATPRDFSTVLGKLGTAEATLANANALQSAARNLKRTESRRADPAAYGAALVDLVEE